MAEFHLIRPWMLLFWLILPLLGWALMRQQSHAGVWQKLLPAHLQPAMLDGAAGTQQKATPVWLLLSLFVAIFALSGPAWDKEEVPLFQLQKGRVLVMDMSDSMWATDLPPNRLTQARFKAMDLLRQAKEGEMALVAYAGDAFPLSPLTEDRATLMNLLPALSPEIMPVRGSNLPAALTQADQLLRDAGYQQGEILLLTDDLSADHTDAALEFASSHPWPIQILALGSEQGTPMKRPSGELIRDLDGSVALVRTHFDRLEKLATASGGRLVRYRADSSDVTALLNQGIRLDEEGDTQSEQHHSQWRDRGGQLLLLALLPLAWGLRRQGLLCLLPVMMLTPRADAAWWQNPDQTAKAQFDAGQYEAAAQTFSDPAWQGAAHYRAGDYEQALDAFEQVEGTDSLYNQGNALAQLGDYPEAAKRYRSVLQDQPDHQMARDNLAWVEEQMAKEPPPESEDQQGEQGDSEQNESEEPQSSGDSGEDPSSPSDPSDQSQPQSDQGEASNQSGDAEPEPEPGTEQQGQSGEETEGDAESEQPQSANAGEGQESEEGKPAQALPTQTEEGQPSDEELQRLLDQVVDDPARLLRNKMELEYERRRQSGDINREQTQW
ncbi:vWA domain-containing protein [Ferrimonas balearica]|uniref:vWA domain-containing protein n=1 Tax=Ferrimonas balearica TaxID=44012 RepID=UPI001C9947DD|nr:VWA domain-containing protein [Ferrimonas balearica]MBY5922104.1 VWA domain-containing protein [Ferrimonas balearica]MBY5994556.1 VWA domain-containing protein [Ferrimonas balearica]